MGRAVGSHRHSAGHMAYLAPERATGRATAPASDLYSWAWSGTGASPGPRRSVSGAAGRRGPRAAPFPALPTTRPRRGCRAGDRAHGQDPWHRPGSARAVAERAGTLAPGPLGTGTLDTAGAAHRRGDHPAGRDLSCPGDRRSARCRVPRFRHRRPGDAGRPARLREPAGAASTSTAAAGDAAAAIGVKRIGAGLAVAAAMTAAGWPDGGA
jgi:hypothetical protein